MSNRTLTSEIITLIHSEANNNPAPLSCKIVKNYGDSPYSDVEVEDLGILVYRKTIGTTMVGSEGIICFLNGDSKEGVVITPPPNINHEIHDGKSFFDVDVVYPIGSVYMSVDGSFNPSEAFGGEWEMINGEILIENSTADQNKVVMWKRIA